MKEYRLAKGWRVVTYLLCAVLAALAVFLVHVSIVDAFRVSHIFYIVAALGLVFLVYYMYKDTRIGRFIIHDEYVTLVSPFGQRTLPIDAIKGFRITENYIIIEPKNKPYKKIKVSVYLGGRGEIQYWLNRYFDNLGEVQVAEEEKEILLNEQFGITYESRSRRLAEARKVAKWSNRISWIVMGWVLFYPKPYTLAVTIGIIYPIVALTICYLYRGLMRSDEEEKSAYPSVVQSFILPALAVVIRTLFDYTVLDYSNGWIVIGIMSITVFVLYQLPTGGFSPRKASEYILLALFPLFSFAYCFGTYVMINCRADNSSPMHYQSVIESKRISSGKTRTYYLNVAAWGDREEGAEVKVSRSDYDGLEIGDTITVIQRDGHLRLPWIEVVF